VGLAVAIGTEKARSEFIIADVLAQRFNAERENSIPYVYGTTTSGTDWLFLKLAGQRLHIDMAVYTIAQYDKILGILSSMVEQKA